MPEEFSSFLAAKLRERRATLRHVAEATGIPEHVLSELLEGSTSHLPAAPYVHGYLVKLGEVLDFDGEEWWGQVKRSMHGVSSGVADRLPKNRFSRKRAPTWLLWVVPLALILATFAAFRFADIVGLPDIAIEEPARDGAVVTSSVLTFRGTASAGSRVTVNGEEVPLSGEGTWQKEVSLQPGVPNDVTAEATKLLGRSRSASRRVFYEIPFAASTTTSTVPASGTSTVTGNVQLPGTSSTPTTTIISF